MRTWTTVAALRMKRHEQIRKRESTTLTEPMDVAMREKEVSRMTAKCLACSFLDGGVIYGERES